MDFEVLIDLLYILSESSIDFKVSFLCRDRFLEQSFNMRTFIFLGLLSITVAFIPQYGSKREVPAMLKGNMPIHREPSFSTRDSKPLEKRASQYLNPKTQSTAHILPQRVPG